MAGREIATAEKIVLGDMLAVLEREQLLTMATVDVNKAGVVLVNERVKVFIKGDDNVPIEFTASLYVQRGAMTDEEAQQVHTVAETRKANAAAKKAEDADVRARDKREAFALGQESTFGALRNIETLNVAAQNLARLAHPAHPVDSTAVALGYRR